MTQDAGTSMSTALPPAPAGFFRPGPGPRAARPAATERDLA
jgi:hypothetical protein